MYISIGTDQYYVLHPRPVYLIVSRGRDGKLNVMSAAWVSPISDEPFTIATSIWKGSLTFQYINETKEFTVNIPSEDHVNAVFKAGTITGRDADKLSLLGLRTFKSKHIETPGLEQMLGFLECRVLNTLEFGESAVFIAEVLEVHVDGKLYTKHGWDLNKAKILLHNGGRSFSIPSKLILPEKQ
ncbi:MAG: flavin reductase family protein [Desulfurococcaceae archaeon]